MLNRLMTSNWRFVLVVPLLAIITIASLYLVQRPALINLVVFGLAGMVVLLTRRPMILVLVCIFSSVLPYQFTLGSAQISLSYVLILVLAWVLLFDRREGDTLWLRGANGWLLLFLAIVILNYFRNPGLPGLATDSSGGDKIRFGYLLFGLTLISGYLVMPFIVRGEAQLRVLVRAMVVFLAVGLAFAWLYYLFSLSSPFVPGYGGKLIQEETGQGTVLRFGWIGGYASSLWPFLLAFVPNQRKWWKAGLGIFLIISVVISGARAQVAGLLVSALLYFSIIRRWNPFLLVTAVLALVAGYMMIFQYGIADQIPQLYRFSPEYTANQFQTVVEGVSQSRLGIYQASLKLMLQNPILGVGPATDDELKQLLTRYMNFVYYDARAGTEAAFANTLAIYGLPTFLIFIIAMVTALYRAFAVYNRSEISENHQLILFCILFVALQLFYNLSGGNAKGGGLDFYVFLSLIDVIYIGLISRPINQKLEDPR